MRKRIIHSIIWVVLAGWFTIIMGFVTKSQETLLCGEIDIEISDSVKIRFVTEERVREQLDNSGLHIQGYPLETIQTRDLEFLLEEDPYVKNAEVFTDVRGNLCIKIVQRSPLLRVIPDGEKGFYIDMDGNMLPLSSEFTPMTLLLTGHTRGLDSDTTAFDQLVKFAKYIDSHPLWSTQIVQIFRDRKGKYEIIPRVGAHQIILGSLDDYLTKLEKLELLYEQGFEKYGWNTYDRINLTYSNQIICTKR